MLLKILTKLSIGVLILVSSHFAWSDIALIVQSTKSHKVIYLNPNNQVCQINCPSGSSRDRSCQLEKASSCMQKQSFEWLFRKKAGFITMKLEKSNLQEELKNTKAKLETSYHKKEYYETELHKVEEELALPDVPEKKKIELETHRKVVRISLQEEIELIVSLENKISTIETEKIPQLENKNLAVGEDIKKIKHFLEADRSLIVNREEPIWGLLLTVFSEISIYLGEKPATNSYSATCAYTYYGGENCGGPVKGTAGTLIGFTSSENLISECKTAAQNKNLSSVQVTLNARDFLVKPIEAAALYIKATCEIYKLQHNFCDDFTYIKLPVYKIVYGHTTQEIRKICHAHAGQENDSRLTSIVEFNDWSL